VKGQLKAACCQLRAINEKLDHLKGKLDCTYHIQAVGEPTRQVKDQAAQAFKDGVAAQTGNNLLQDLVLVKDHCAS